MALALYSQKQLGAIFEGKGKECNIMAKNLAVRLNNDGNLTSDFRGA